MNKLNKILLSISIILMIALVIMVGLYCNLKSKYTKLEADFLFSQNGEDLEKNKDGNFLFSEERK